MHLLIYFFATIGFVFVTMSIVYFAYLKLCKQDNNNTKKEYFKKYKIEFRKNSLGITI